MQHHFEIEDAKKYGVDKAVLMENFRFWMTKNKADRRHIHEGRVWTYNSARALSELLPYWSRQKIARMLRELVADGVILSANFNKTMYDRTLWYSLKEPLSIVQDETMESPIENNQKSETEQPIPYPKPDRKPVKKPSVKKDSRIKYLIDFFFTSYKERTDRQPTVSGAWGKGFQRLLVHNTEDEIRAVISFFFAYRDRTQFSFTTFLAKYDNLSPMALRSLKKVDAGTTTWEKITTEEAEALICS